MFQKLLLQTGFISLPPTSFLARKSFIKTIAHWIISFPQPFVFHAEKTVLRKEKFWGRHIFFFFSLIHGLESSNWTGGTICSMSPLLEQKQKRKHSGFGKKLFLWTYSIGLWHNSCASIKSLNVCWSGSCASGISLLSSALLGLLRAPRRFSFKNLSWSQELHLLVLLYSFLFVPVY